MKHLLPSPNRKNTFEGSSILQWLVYNLSSTLFLPRLVPVRIAAVLLVLFTTFQVQAQEVLLGLTSDYGLQGGGTAFSIKSNGTSFAVHNTFTKLGSNPGGELIQGKDGNFYGMTARGGASNYGTIFKMTPAGKITIMNSFAGYDGNAPGGNNLIQASDGNFYGMTSSGGLNNEGAEPGVAFRMTPGGEYKVIFSFIRHLGYRPYGDLVEGTDGNFYGMTYYGGTFDKGTVFKLTPTGTHTVLHNFNGTSRGGWPTGNLVRGNDGNYYGVTTSGGANQLGTIFKITPTGTFTLLHTFETATGGTPIGSLTKGKDGNFYGVTTAGGDNFSGTIYRITATGDYKVLHHYGFDEIGDTPKRSLKLGKDGNFYGTTMNGGDWFNGTVYKVTPSGTVSALHPFLPSEDGGRANGLMQASDGYLYGMNEIGGPQGDGVIYRILPNGSNFKILVDLPGTFGGVTPRGGLVQGRDGFFYGMTEWGGEYNHGTIFRLCSDGSFKILRSLDDVNDGGYPRGDLMLGKDGNFYGLTSHGGVNGSGTYFRITPKGDFKVLYSFQNDDTGYSPWGTLLDGNDGYYYGMTNAGGSFLAGVIFRVTPSGEYTVMHSFDNYEDGSSPRGNLIKGKDGNFYGLTNVGGDYNTGTFFKMAPDGTVTKLHSFYQYDDGDLPAGSLVQGKDGNFYGMAARGGKNGHGTIFKFTPAGKITVLKFMTDEISDGANPQGSLIMDKVGNFYGLTWGGGHNFSGVIFKITPDGKYTILHHLDGPTEGRSPFGSLIFQKSNPTAYAQSVTTAVNTAKAITLKGTGGSPLVYEIISQPKNGTLSGSGAKRTYTPNSNFNGSDTFTYRVSWGCQSSTVKIITIQVGKAVASTIRINTGGSGLTTSLGNFSADTYFTGATDVSSTASAIANTTNEDLYQDNRRASAAGGSFQYVIPVTNGTYTVKLHFAEIYYSAAGQRKFNVTAEGAIWLTNYDIYAAAGGARKAVVATRNVTVSDGTLNLNFISTVDKACVSAIEVLPVSGTEQLVADIPTREESELVTNLYPNPATYKFTVDLKVPTEQISTSILDASGIVVKANIQIRVETGKLEFTVDQLPPGLYTLLVNYNGGQQILRFIKK
ncbi:choice-of-anchor tandem repeat GloVer-containing protein [Adhaeribacter radiodurans]|uniref:T9SS type A sorting domain-containing protein n=1 Tax=Adhaeribacter radiodurans TaxID=2745197 RepID=A0A7L7L4C9_9BACT|nr:choice-of-anchor tandem repeat GloVer-containing protein [Adhaeribacter radiodurans]QMU27671.1 T9SS type A sorting domain-containing protein [Adhaeribacter radiodurans]